MLSPEPLRGLDLMTQAKYHRTNISLQLAKNNVRSLPPIPHPYGWFRANGSHPAVARDRPDSAFFEFGVGTLSLFYRDLSAAARERRALGG